MKKTQTQFEITQTQLEQKQTQLEKRQKKHKGQNNNTEKKLSKDIRDLGARANTFNKDIKEVRLLC